MSPKSPPSFFSVWQKNGCSKTPIDPPFTFFGTIRLTGGQKNFEKIKKNFSFFVKFSPHAGTVEENTRHFEVLWPFFSLRYGAGDLGRFRLVFKIMRSWFYEIM